MRIQSTIRTDPDPRPHPLAFARGARSTPEPCPRAGGAPAAPQRSRVSGSAAGAALAALALAAALAASCAQEPEPAPAAPAAGGHDHAAHGLAREGSPAAPAAGAEGEIAYYTCAMHPSVRSAEPGACPICSMELVPVTAEEQAAGVVRLAAERRQEIGVTTARAELRPLSVPVRAVGEVTFDQTRLTDVSLKIRGWIGDLYVDRPGQAVRKGQPLFTLYSPELFAAQREFLTALESQRAARETGAPSRADYLVAAARDRLRLWDLATDQIDRLAATGEPVERIPILSPASGHVVEKNVVAGGAVEPGMTLFRIAGLDRVWVEAEVYESELPLLAVGDAAAVALPQLPGRSFAGRIAFVYPWLEGESRTGRVRVELPNPGLELKPEMYAEVVLEHALGERLAVPEESILYAGDRRYVFLDLGDGRLRPQAVTAGRSAGEWVEILDGLAPGDLVVTSGNFLIAAEARLKLALDHWAEPAGGEAGAAPPAGERGAHAGHAPEPRR
jgi:Cu(I)/Ag(I) efflux system membrane fusion protein